MFWFGGENTHDDAILLQEQMTSQRTSRAEWTLTVRQHSGYLFFKEVVRVVTKTIVI